MLSLVQASFLPCSQAGLQITAGQRTMSGQKQVLSGQILRWPDNLSVRLRWQGKNLEFNIIVIIDVCPAKNGICPSKNWFDRTI